MEMPNDDVGTNSLISSNRMDDGLMSIADNFTVLIVVLYNQHLYCLSFGRNGSCDLYSSPPIFFSNKRKLVFSYLNSYMFIPL